MSKKIDAAYFFRNLKKSFDKRFPLFLFRFRRSLVKQELYIFCDNMLSAVTEEIEAFPLFCYCRDNGIPAAYIAVKDGFLYESMSGKSSNGIFFESKFQENWFRNKDLAALLVRAKAVITAFGGINVETEKLIKRLDIEYIFLGHGVTFFKTYGLQFFKTERGFDRILVCNDYEKEIFARYGWKEREYISAGLPRWEKLPMPAASSQSRRILFFFTWRNSFVRTERTAEIGEFEYIKKLKSLLSSDALRELKEKYDVDFIIAPHHAMHDLCGIDLAPIVGDTAVIIDSRQLSRYIAGSSLLVTDYSSVFADFYFQEKPVIFYRLDENDGRLGEPDRESAESAASQTRRVHNVINSEEELFGRLEHYIKRNFAMDGEEREKANAFFYTKDGICEKTMEQIMRK